MCFEAGILIVAANNQLDLMGRYMSELGLTPTVRFRIVDLEGEQDAEMPMTIRLIGVASGERDGETVENPGELGVIEIDQKV